jgi:hypothetical protein
MFPTIWFIFFFLITLSKELFFFDEELLVVNSFFIIFSILFSGLSSLISTELRNRHMTILSQFSDYIIAKQSILDLLLIFYKQRNNSFLYKFNEIVKEYSIVLSQNFQTYIVSFIYDFQRLFISKLMIILSFESLYLKKETLSAISINNTENRIFFFLNNLILN